MSTRSMIGKDYGDEIKAIYCHWDGYPEHTGQILKDYYNSDTMVDKLIALGDISSIAPTLDFKDKSLLNREFVIPNGKIKIEPSSEERYLFKATIQENDEITEKLVDRFDAQEYIFRLDYKYGEDNKDIEQFYKVFRENQGTIAYCRDRGEPFNQNHYRDENEFLSKVVDSWCEYAYLWKNDAWYMMKVYSDDDDRKLEKF